mmetsp:Transcript_7220/g.10560  ORF Transcript_7220/g.10560 Transcript_7220/m.10560 type:complete len:197 (+) Transcript_7220:96-686(+)|eukprot:CAMPEP_0194200572 /NCGR_PEP_ID=MMETSP0156-20130528/1117_1 /TAXON_ID=33649 /ORGANISM="Thalassionema nitzschioides, Strain L26-B" /LENGTH=196 /DNA_ID=CAMNT_0038925581 /DNA_START=30 /DNA_END=620 /DNA_ORIENTATION=-
MFSSSTSKGGSVTLELKCLKLTNTEGVFAKSDPFYVVRNAKGKQLFKSEQVKDNLNPVWKSNTFKVFDLAHDTNLSAQKVSIEFYDFEKSGKHILMGEVKTSLKGLVDAASKALNLTLKKKDKKGKEHDTGTLVVTKANVELPKPPPPPKAPKVEAVKPSTPSATPEEEQGPNMMVFIGVVAAVALGAVIFMRSRK